MEIITNSLIFLLLGKCFLCLFLTIVVAFLLPCANNLLTSQMDEWLEVKLIYYFTIYYLLFI